MIIFFINNIIIIDVICFVCYNYYHYYFCSIIIVIIIIIIIIIIITMRVIGTKSKVRFYNDKSDIVISIVYALQSKLVQMVLLDCTIEDGRL